MGSDPRNTYRSAMLSALPGKTEWFAQTAEQCTANTAKSPPPEELAGNTQCIKLTQHGAAVKYRLWRSPRSYCLSASLGCLLAPPRCSGQIGARLDGNQQLFINKGCPAWITQRNDGGCTCPDERCGRDPCHLPQNPRC